MTRAGASWASAGFAALLVLFLVLPGLGRAPFDDPGEGQHAEIAREAWVSGDLLDLRLNGVRYFDKPPLLYWLIALDFRAWGVSEWAARLPSVLGAALAAAATALLGARLLNPMGGALAGAALGSCALFVVFARYVRPETLFVAAIQLGLTGLLLTLCEGGTSTSRRWSIFGCTSLGVAALAKDPLGLLAPLAAVMAALALCGQLRPLRRWLPATGVALMLLLGLGWYAWAGLRQPGFLWYTVVDNHLLNAAGLRRFPDEDVPLGTGEFLAVSALGAFPWVVAAVGTVASLLWRRAWRDPDEAPWMALSIWSAGLWALFVVSAFKLPHYALPAYPAVALLAARWWIEDPTGGRRPALVHLALFAPLAVGLALVAAGDGGAFVGTVFSATDVYTRKELAGAQASPLPPWAALQPLVTRTAFLFGMGAVALAVCAWRRAGWWAGAVVAATMLAGGGGARRSWHGRGSAAIRLARGCPCSRRAHRELGRPRALFGAPAGSRGRAAQRARYGRHVRRQRARLLDGGRAPRRLAVRPSDPARHAARSPAFRGRDPAAASGEAARHGKRPLALRVCHRAAAIARRLLS